MQELEKDLEQLEFLADQLSDHDAISVSYTHLDVYKRQGRHRLRGRIKEKTKEELLLVQRDDSTVRKKLKEEYYGDSKNECEYGKICDRCV